MKIYLLYDYEEHGPENTFATTDPNMVVRALRELWKADQKVIDAAQALIAKGELGTAPDMGQGWGSVELMVLEENRVEPGYIDPRLEGKLE